MATPEAVQMMQVAAQAAQAAAEAAAALKQFAERDGNDRQKFSEASKVVVKMPEVFGTEDHEADARNWRDFLLNFKSWLFYADKTFESGLSNVESNPKNVVSLAAMNEESKAKAVQLYAILTRLLKGKPLRLLRQQDDRNGLEVYRQLCQLYTPQSKTRALSVLQAFMQFPVFTKDKTLSEQILSLERLRSEYTKCSGQDLSDDLCLSVLVRCLPSQLRQHVQLQMQDTHTFNDIKNYALSYELTTSSWTTSKVHTELGVIPAPLPAGGPAPMEIDALTAKGKGKGKFKGKFDGKNGKGKKGGKSKSSGKGGKFQSSWQDRQQGGQGQLQSNQNSWHNYGGSWHQSGWQNRQGQWNGWNQKGSKDGKGKNDSSGKGKGGWNSNKGSWNNGRVNQMSDVAEQSTASGGQSTAGASSAAGSNSAVSTSAGVSHGSSSSNSGNVRLLTRVSSGFVEDLSNSGRYNGGNLQHFRVLQDLSCPTHDMTATDDDDHWHYPPCFEDISHVRTVTYSPQPGEPIEVLLDSGADGSALPLSFGNMGVSIGGSHGMNYVDAQGSPLGIQDVRVAEIHFGDVCIRDKFIIAPVTGPIISLGLLMKLGWNFSREDGCLMLVKEGHSFPIEFRKNSIVAHGTISLLQDVANPVHDVSGNKKFISAIRLTALSNLQEGWNKLSDDVWAIKTYAPQHVDTTLCPSRVLMWLRTTLARYYHGLEVLEHCQPIEELENYESDIPNREAVCEVITIAHNHRVPAEFLGFEMTDEDEFLEYAPEIAQPNPADPLDDIMVDVQDDPQPPRDPEEGEPPVEDRVVEIPEDFVMVDGVCISQDTPLRVIRIACEHLGLSKKGSKKQCLSRLFTFITNQKLVASHSAEATIRTESAREPVVQKAPVVPTEAQIAKHNLTHEPYEDWCEECVANRARQDKHPRADHSHSSHSVVSFDFGFASRLEDEPKIAILCVHDRDTGLIHAVPSLTKGGKYFNYLTTELTRFIVMTQHREVALRCDGEPSTKALMESVAKTCKGLGIKVYFEPVVIGSHQSNGAAEKVVDLVRSLANTLISSLEKSCGLDKVTFGAMHPVYGWALAHASFLHNRFRVSDGQTAYERAYDRMYTGKLVSFGEAVLGYLKTEFKGRAKWLKGIWPFPHSSDAHIVAYQGTLFVTRSVRRLPVQHNLDLLSAIEAFLLGKHSQLIQKQYTSDEAASDPPSEVEEAQIAPPQAAVESQDVSVGQQQSQQGVTSQAGTVSSSPFPKSSPIPSAPMDVSTSSGSGVIRGADSSAVPEQRPEKQARLNAISQQLGDYFDEKHEDEAIQFDFNSEELELLEDYDNDLYFYEDDFEDEAYDDSSTSDCKLKALIFPYTLQEPQLSEAELQVLDGLADELEMERLRDMKVLNDPTEAGESPKRLSTRFVRTWRDKYVAGEHVWLRRSRFVAREYAWADQRSDLFSPASSSIASRILPTLFMRKFRDGHILGAVDVADAFLTVKQREATLVTACDSLGNKTDYSLGRVLPGQRLGSQLWYEDFSTYLKHELNFCQCGAYPSLLKESGGRCYLLLHVDDMLISGDAKFIDEKLVPLLQKKYKISSSFIRSVGDELVFLKRTHRLVSTDRLIISTHPKHVEQLVKLTGIKTSGALKKVPGHPQMDDVDDTPELEAHECSTFRSCIGILLYLAPDLPHAQHAIRHLSSAMSKPTRRQKDVLRHLVSYLYASKDLCLSLQFTGDTNGLHHVYDDDCKAYLEVFSDADWAASKQTRRSISSCCILFGTCLLHSSSRTQKLVSLSSGESETYAASSAACDGILIQRLLEFCINKPVCTVHYLDSSAARGILQRQGVGRVRHMSCRILWFQELLKLPERKHRVSPVAGNLNVSDIGTKRLPKHRLEQLMGFCNIGSMYADTFLPLKQDQTLMTQNQLRQTVGALPAWQLRLMVLGALGQPAHSFQMHDNNNEPNTLWLVMAALILCIFTTLVYGYAMGCQCPQRFRGLLAMWRSSNDVDLSLDTATRRRYLDAPMSECSDPDLWMRLHHHNDLPSSPSEVPNTTSNPSAPTALELEARILVLLDLFVEYAMNALQQEIEPSLSLSETMYVLRVAYFHLLESSTHMDDVEDIVAIYECEDTDNYFSRRNYALQWVVATGGHYNLQRGSSMAEELKYVMDCLIHRAGQGNDVPKAVYKSLKSTNDSLWKQFHADLCAREIEAKESTSESNSNMQVDTAVEDPPVAIPNLDDQLEELRVARERAMATLQDRYQDAMDSGDLDAADFYDNQMSVLNMM
eukprot:symbB.v1.2.032893.t1/scaffold4013.1/size46388/4